MSPAKQSLDTLLSSQLQERQEEIKTLLTTKTLKENELTSQLNDLEEKLREASCEIREFQDKIDEVE